MKTRDYFRLLVLEARIAIPPWAWGLPLSLFVAQGIRGWPNNPEAVRTAELLLPLPFSLLIIMAFSKEREKGLTETWVCTNLSKAWSLGVRWLSLVVWTVLGITALMPRSLWPDGVDVLIACWMLGGIAGVTTVLGRDIWGTSLALLWWTLSLIVTIERPEALLQPPWDFLWLGLRSIHPTEEAIWTRKAVQLGVGWVCLALSLFRAHRY